ncbi:MAG: 7-cyano-7-deazaguanine synthase QueC [Lentisphaeraceae bacterium]|nr:7-cyano-7-deazaguanine synthase QueC [Lentisphaeraceae bacterium]
MMKKCVILVSGGMDSVSLLHYAINSLKVDEVYALSFDYGQKHSRELKEAKWNCDKFPEVKEHRVLDLHFMKEILQGSSSLVGDVIDVPDLDNISDADLDQPITYVPNRNMMLLSLAASYAESRDCREIFYGAQAQDEYGYWDCTVDFLEKMNQVMSLNRRKGVEILAPFVNKSKGEVVDIGFENGVDFSKTWTCYRGGEKPCKTCPSCVERELAFEKAGKLDPLIK